MKKVRQLFNAMTFRFLAMKKNLAEDAHIIANMTFDNAIVKSFDITFEEMKLSHKIQLPRFEKCCEPIVPVA